MSDFNENPTPDQPAYVEPKALTPYRHKLVQSAAAVAYAMRGRPNMDQAKQVRMLSAVVAELRKMSAGAQKALEIAQNRDYAAYLQAKKDLAEGKLNAAEQAEFESLVSGLTGGSGEYVFTPDEVDPDDEAAMTKLDEISQPEEGPTSAV